MLNFHLIEFLFWYAVPVLLLSFVIEVDEAVYEFFIPAGMFFFFFSFFFL